MDVVPVVEGCGCVGTVVDVDVKGGIPPLERNQLRHLGGVGMSGKEWDMVKVGRMRIEEVYMPVG